MRKILSGIKMNKVTLTITCVGNPLGCGAVYECSVLELDTNLNNGFSFKCPDCGNRTIISHDAIRHAVTDSLKRGSAAG